MSEPGAEPIRSVKGLARRRSARALLAASLVAPALLAGLGIASAEPVSSLADGRSGRVEFPSATPTGPTQLVQRSYAEGAVVTGELTVPASGAERAPAMVIAHGSGGVLPGREDAWARRLHALGIATFAVDSFGPRGLRTTARDQSRLSTMANLADALFALRLLATHPRIDPERIGVIGFSRGGQVALYSALEPLRRAVVDGDLRFAAHVALYPSCSIPYRAAKVTGAPILMLLGGADDYTPAPACRAYADWFRGRGAAARVIEYPGAYHDFDIPEPPRFLPALQSARGCHAEVDVDIGAVRRLDSGEALRGDAAGAFLRGCMQRGATMGGNAAALAEAERDVTAFLSQRFGLAAPRPPADGPGARQAPADRRRGRG